MISPSRSWLALVFASLGILLSIRTVRGQECPPIDATESVTVEAQAPADAYPGYWYSGGGDPMASAFDGCRNSCGNPCQNTECPVVCDRRSTSCVACCNLHYNRSLMDCKRNPDCIANQSTEWNACKTNCTGI